MHNNAPGSANRDVKRDKMSGAELLCLNLTETRRRSIRIWRAILLSRCDWRPDPDAMSFFEMVRHVLEGDYLYGQMTRERRSYSGHSPFADRHFDDLDAALAFANPYRKSLLETVRQLSDDDLNTIAIDRSDVGYIRKAGDFILRIAYHEAVHAGQMLQYLRMAGVPRPSIWD
jgi:uncharacterized damage-inducible protein DinB